MKHYILKHPNGETLITQSLDGYEDCQLLGEHNGEVEDACVFDKNTKKLKRCAETHAKREREHIARDPQALLDMIEALEERVAALEKGAL